MPFFTGKEQDFSLINQMKEKYDLTRDTRGFLSRLSMALPFSFLQRYYQENNQERCDQTNVQQVQLL